MINQRELNWVPDLNLPDDEMLHDEARAVEYSRSFTLFCLHESILKYGQDLKNEEWIIEPLANMVIALAIMDTCFKRYMQIESGEHKNQTLDVLKLSIADQFENCSKSGLDLIQELFTGEKLSEKLKIINMWYEKTNYTPRRIECQKKIANMLYEQKKYYLD